MNDTKTEFIRKKMEEAVNTFHDVLGVPRLGREPDFINGRWCIKCQNSLPLDHEGPCDVCGYEPRPVVFDGMMYADVAKRTGVKP